MRMHYFKWLLLSLAVASVASAGVRYIERGPVWGKWDIGDSVVVEEGAFVPEGESLTIDHAVHVVFEGFRRFEVSGTLTVLGTPDSPVTFSGGDGWMGIRLHGEGGWHTLNYVKFSSQLGLARQCVEIIGGGLEMNGCNLEAAENCLKVTGSELHVRNNSFLTHRLYSKVVILNGLEGEASSDCDRQPGNIFKGNFIRANVPQLSPGDPIDPNGWTAGLWVERSTNICMSYNNISVYSPLMAMGVRFGDTPQFGDRSWDLDHTIIYVESLLHMVIGVFNETDGDLDVSKMTITALGAQGYGSSCFFATSTSYIRINSTTSIMRNPTDIFFNTSGAGRIDANYLVQWTTAETNLTMANPNRPSTAKLVLTSFDEDAVNIGDSVWIADPGFAQVGELGHWNTSHEIEAYYTLTSGSPCIDHGDPERGLDPDNTRLDIGRFYYHQVLSPVDDRPELPETVMLSAYPNPFNPSTILPFEVAMPGLLKVTVYDVLGREVYSSTNAVYAAGLQNVHFQASALASGLYLAQAEMNGQFIGSQKLLLVK
jgi:hypothetical protein